MTLSAKRLVYRLVWFVSFGVTALIVASWLYVQHQQRPVIRWFAPTVEDASMAELGDVGEIHLSFSLLRDRCLPNPAENVLIMEDIAGVHRINQRSPIRTEFTPGPHDLTVLFEVPRFARPGPARLYIRGTTICRGAFGDKWTLPFQSRPAPFEVMEPPS